MLTLDQLKFPIIFSLKDVTTLTHKANVVYCLNGSCDMTQSYIGKTKRHLAVRVQQHLSGKSAIHDHISSCKGCHSCSISNYYTISQANTDFEAKIKEALHIKIYTIIKQPNISLWFVLFCLF